MRRVVSAALVLLLSIIGSACFGPDFGRIACTESVGCPGDLVCVSGFCVSRGGQETDAAGSFVVSDDGPDDFGLGDFFFSSYDGIGVVPESQSGGRFTSRVFDSGVAGTLWTSFVFTPSGPYGKPLPDDAGIEAGYRDGNMDMTDNLVLLHCEDAGGSSLLDTSGREHIVTPTMGSSISFRNGVLGDACGIGPGQTFQIPITPSGGLSTGDSDYTWMMWVRTSTSCTGNDVFMGMDADPSSSNGSHQWLGCARGDGVDGNSACDPAVLGSVAGTHRANQVVPGGSFCGTPIINDNDWHHIALVKQGHSSYEHRVYVDGVRVDTLTGSYLAEFNYEPGNNLTFGTFPAPGFDTEAGEIDEVAIFNRALEDADIASMIARSASSIRVRVRTCDRADCGDGRFGGIDGGETDIVDPAGALGPPQPFPLELSPGRYFQYEVEFSRDLGAVPRFEVATITGVTP